MAKQKKYEDSHFEEHLESQTIVDIDIEKRMREAFIDYAMSVIVSRALPDVRDGLKPVHRRILYSMFEEHLTVFEIKLDGIALKSNNALDYRLAVVPRSLIGYPVSLKDNDIAPGRSVEDVS